MADKGITGDGSGWVAGDVYVGLTGMLAGSRLLSHSHIRGKKASDHVNSSLVHGGNTHCAITNTKMMSGGEQDREGPARASGTASVKQPPSPLQPYTSCGVQVHHHNSHACQYLCFASTPLLSVQKIIAADV